MCSMTRPRREYIFNTVQTSGLSDYIPSKTRQPERRAMFEGGNQGVVIAWQQKVAAMASESAFGEVVATGGEQQTKDLADLLAITAMGTAYHTYAQNSADEVMFRRIKLPRMFDADTKRYTTQAELVEKAQYGLAHAAGLVSVIDEMVYKGRSREQITKKGLALGRSLATTGVTLAVIKDGVANLRLDEVDMQEEARLAAQASYEKSVNLTKQLGTRPTLAQFADDRSPWMQYLNTDEASVSQPVYETLVSRISVAERQLLRAEE